MTVHGSSVRASLMLAILLGCIYGQLAHGLNNAALPGMVRMGVANVNAYLGCHPVWVVLKSKFKGADWLPILNKMGSYSESSIYQPGELRIPAMRPYKVQPNPGAEKLSAFLSSINLSSSADGE